MAMTIGLHQANANTQGLWQFAQNLNDSSGNGRTLTATNTARYTKLWPKGPSAFLFDGTNYLSQTNAAFQITGDLTVVCLWCPRFTSGPGNAIFYCAGPTVSSALAAQNYLYSLVMPTNARWVYLTESGSGTPYTGTFDVQNVSSGLYHIALTRSGTTVDLYLNRRKYQTLSGVTSPTGGTSSNLYLGAGPLYGTQQGAIASFRVDNAAMTQAQIEAEYDATLGQLYNERAA